MDRMVFLVVAIAFVVMVYGEVSSPTYGDFATTKEKEQFRHLHQEEEDTAGSGIHDIAILFISGMMSPVVVLCMCTTILAIYTVCKSPPKSSESAQFQKALENKIVRPRMFAFHHIERITHSFHENFKIGQGGTGIVYKGMLDDGTPVALKRLQRPKTHTEKFLNEFLNEVHLISGIRHKNLIQLKGCSVTEKEYILVYEYAMNGDLRDVLWGSFFHKGNVLSWSQRLSISIGIANGLAYLNLCTSPYLLHRDIKSANILLDEAMVPKIADFGLAKSFLRNEIRDETDEMKTGAIRGTWGYGAPEYMEFGKLNSKLDVYSFGIVLLEIVSGKQCLKAPEGVELNYHKYWVETLRREGKLLEFLDPKLQGSCPPGEVIAVLDIASFCINRVPERRPDMAEVYVRLKNIRLPHRDHDAVALPMTTVTSSSSTSGSHLHSITTE